MKQKALECRFCYRKYNLDIYMVNIGEQRKFKINHCLSTNERNQTNKNNSKNAESIVELIEFSSMGEFDQSIIINIYQCASEIPQMSAYFGLDQRIAISWWPHCTSSSRQMQW